VVIGHEEEYSIWLVNREKPTGWADAGFVGSKQERLDYTNKVWLSMRPDELLKKMEEMEKEKKRKK